ncbi:MULTISPECIES: glycosyltransferase [unclassified Paracoccus (in: a-proteobacteria)]|uniref:glycosyltransferase n=1 Tax=unclassified Paracoccus (in: a-proteobacteria) TaxID=2688777 RepID=UPI0016011BE0|nr:MULTISPECIES: glycosyltransferase [unclassified Paracoccus (in: a-proteobacteria)]MBB1490782.1 glycosyltransferase [Paracoccus sp. MC1854]MBB1497375.1 glycosyltransferase [Paracoccus sp. MC1862]QQO45868.1 glycosyltransferase [Paracoccus sp. MC1862]
MDKTLRIAILLATYQGGRYIGAQLDSLAAQDHRNWRLIVSDDGSTDQTLHIVRGFAARHPGRDIQILRGPRQGATRNFLSMIGAVEPGDALAWCDQDDVWLPSRLSHGVEALAAAKEQAGTGFGILHVTRTTICDADLHPLRPAPLYRRPASFANALVQACTPGNTMLVDPAGVTLLKAAQPGAMEAGVISHDWWSYQVISGAGGLVIRDPRQTVLYRQHRGNVMGRNDTPRAALARLGRLGAGDYGNWLRQNVAALDAARDVLTPENAAMLDGFAAAITAPGPLAAARLAQLSVYRQTRAGTAALLLAAAAGRLHP